MLINKGIKEIAKNIAWSESIRPALSGLRFLNNKIVATDSFKLLELTFNDIEIKEKLKDVNIRNFKHTENNDFMIKTEDILALKEPTKMNPDILNNIFIGNIDKDKDEISLATTNNKNEMLMNTKLMGSNFPDYESFFDNLEIKSSTNLSIDHLMNLLKTMKLNGVQDIQLSITANNGPVLISSYKDISKYIKSIRSIVMPLKK